MFKTILLAYDGSECAQRAAEYAGELAAKFGGSVFVMYAFHPIPRGWDAALAEQARKTEIAQGKASIAAVVERLRTAGVPVESQVVEGMAADAILKAARLRKPEAIVIGASGMGHSDFFPLGSVSDRVAHGAACPVLIVK